MFKSEVNSAYEAYVRMLEDDAYWAWEDEHRGDEDSENTWAWSFAFENDPEGREEMERDDLRCGGTFSELLAASR